MSLGKDLSKEVRKIFESRWTTREGQKVPESDQIKLGNDAVRLDGTVLYADMTDSTALVDNYRDWFAAEVLKAYLHSAAKIIRSEGGIITAYDGDRIMAVFIGGSKNTSAARCGLKLNYAVKEILNPAIAIRWHRHQPTVCCEDRDQRIERSSLGRASSKLCREALFVVSQLPNADH